MCEMSEGLREAQWNSHIGDSLLTGLGIDAGP